MMTAKNIAFIGMMGSGKTTISKALSRALPGFEYVDIDAKIENESGKKITEIFSQHGEEYFRILENQEIQKVCAGQNQIISLGGGAFENSQNREILLKSATTIYLKASAQEIYNRIKNEVHRPLLAKDFLPEDIEKIIKKRKNNYEKATIMINTDGKSPDCIVKEILGVLNDKS